ncbi:glucokinase [Kaistella flava (ex Peng et al. 2021)]|uniref:Glucokinase n=1 Tax=Kaistella flava (ex Peng et al. 2021) TaxID=2038776 RepID=A0A7M2YCJ9_9FLAO|nr:glucokinase [Kaistella flava (ex Peng et al. 2021)]QOW11851.1 glucokinase [Kaistella flava (ex Peng et al. 2021)]
MENFKAISFPDISNATLPMAYPSGQNKLPESGMVLAADVGGTKTELALFQIEKGKLISIKDQRYPTTDHDSFVKAIRNFHGDELSTINCACLGVAGTVDGDKVRGVNFAWEIDTKKLEKDLNIKSINLINDLEANAYGLSTLKDADFEILTDGQKAEGNAAIISPGTGLGEAVLYWDGSHYHPYATEGGHCNFSPNTTLDMEFWKYLKTKFDHVSWERVVSGQGIHNIYQFLRNYRSEKEPDWLTEKFKNEDLAKVISTAALENKDSTCVETLQLFVRYLSVEAAQLALKTKATGGIYIGGGIAPKILNLIDKKEFYKNFINVGRMEHLLKNIPVKIVLNDKTALIGAAYYAAMAIVETVQK